MCKSHFERAAGPRLSPAEPAPRLGGARRRSPNLAEISPKSRRISPRDPISTNRARVATNRQSAGCVPRQRRIERRCSSVRSRYHLGANRGRNFGAIEQLSNAGVPWSGAQRGGRPRVKPPRGTPPRPPPARHVAAPRGYRLCAAARAPPRPTSKATRPLDIFLRGPCECCACKAAPCALGAPTAGRC